MNNQTETAKSNEPNSSKQEKDASNREQRKEHLMTPEHNIVDVFEFEPVGFISNSRW